MTLETPFDARTGPIDGPAREVRKLGQDSAALSKTRFDFATLPNGLTVLGEPQPQARSVALGYFVRTGSRDEGPSEGGLSHFLEHMAFKGTREIDAFELNRRFDLLGASVNAFTGEEVTAYHAATLPEHATELLELLTGLLRPELRREDFDLEKAVILEEIEMYDDMPESRLFDFLRPQFYGGHPLGNSVLGSRSSVSSLSRESMLEYHGRHYAPNNLTLAFVGNYRWDALLERVSELTGGWTAGVTSRAYPEFLARSSVQILPDETLSRALMGMMYPGFPATDGRKLASSVLADILGGENGRLHWALLDTGLADEASLSHQESDGLGHFEGFLSCDPERALQCLEIFDGVLERVTREGITEAELRRARNRMAVATALRDDTPYPRLFALGLEYLYTGKLLSTAEGVEQVCAVTLEQVQEVLEQRPFTVRSLTALGKVEKLEGKI